MLAVKTMNALWVRPKMAGMESTAKSRSVRPMVTKTISIGVKTFLPSTTVRSLPPSNFSDIGRTLRIRAMSGFSLSSSSSPSSWACFQAVHSRKAPKM